MGLRKNRVEDGVTRPVDAFEKGSKERQFYGDSLPKRSNEEQAYMTELYMEYERLMFVIAGRYAADPFEQEEIVQIALVRLWEKIDTLRQVSPQAVASYIAVTIRNTAINYRRKHSKEAGRQVPLDTALEALPELQVLPADARLLAHEIGRRCCGRTGACRRKDQFLLEESTSCTAPVRRWRSS